MFDSSKKMPKNRNMLANPSTNTNKIKTIKTSRLKFFLLGVGATMLLLAILVGVYAAMFQVRLQKNLQPPLHR